MARTKNCPKCDADITESYQGDDPDVGISAGWYCDACDEGYVDEGDDYHDDDVMVSGTPHSSHKCIKCNVPYEFGYGLAGGGIGPYMYCPSCSAIIHKMQDFT